MLQSINHLCGDKIGASDGEIGHIRDFYFDDKHWAVRYMVVDTGSWIFGRSVLISPHSFSSLYQPGKLMLVNLTRQQIEESPPMDSHKPVTRQYEEAYLRYYGWPFYWLGGGVWGMNSIPVIPFASDRTSGLDPIQSNHHLVNFDAHLQSSLDIGRYDVHGGDDLESEPVGKVVDFLMDDQDWVIRHVVMKTGKWAAEKSMLLSPDQVVRIETPSPKLHVSLSREDILQACTYDEEAIVP